MADFSQFLRKPSGQAPKPVALPPSTYPGIIKSFETGDQNKKNTPYVRFHLGLTGWPDGVGEEDRAQKLPDGSSKPIDLSKRPLRRDFFLTDEALYRLDEFLRSCGIEGVGQRTYEEVLPEVVGKPVQVEVQQYLNQNTNELANQVGQVKGEGA